MPYSSNSDKPDLLALGRETFSKRADAGPIVENIRFAFAESALHESPGRDADWNFREQRVGAAG
jgi:hypothetical protein